MGSKRRARRRPLQAAIGMLVSAVLALGLVPLLAFAAAGEGGGAPDAPGIAAGDAQGAGAPEGSPKQLTVAPPATAPDGVPLGAQDEGNLYAVFDSEYGSLIFKREAGTYADGEEAGTLTYYTGVEDKMYSMSLQPSWLAKHDFIKEVNFQADVAPISCAYWFAGCAELEEVFNADRLDVSGAATMKGMFSGCSSLASLDASKWDTSKVADMEGMFEGCSKLASLDVSGWDTSGAESMYCMFEGCSKLSSVTLGEKFSFRGAAGIPSEYYAVLPDAPDYKAHTGRWVNSSEPGAQGVTAAELRDGYPDATDPSLAPGTYVWEAATMVAVFDGADGSLTFKREAGVYTDGQVVGTKTYYTGVEDEVYWMSLQPSWLAKHDFIKEVDFQEDVKPRSCAYWFYNCQNLERVLNASRLDTSDTTYMDYMFYNCSSLVSLDVSKWDTSEITDMDGMFASCSSLPSLDVSGWKTSGVADMRALFSGCKKLASLDVSGWDTSGVADMAYMFEGCSKLSSLDVSGWSTSIVAEMTCMFDGCSSLSSLDVSGWDTSGAANMTSMFSGCSSLSSLDVSGWDTSAVTKMYSMFNGCSSLDFLDLVEWDTSAAKEMNDMFSGCTSLSSVRLGERFSFKGAATSPSNYAVLPDAPTSLGCGGKWICESATGAEGVTAEALCDHYPDATTPEYAIGTYVWEGSTKVAVFDSEGGSLTFKRETNAYTDGQEVGSLTYYTGFENKNYSSDSRPSWLAHARDIEKVDFRTVVAPKNCAFWFTSCRNLAEVLNAGRLDASGVTNMDSMFGGCSSLSSLDVSGWVTSKAVNMSSMFSGCSSLSSLDVSGWDTSKVEDMGSMFSGCSSLSSLDVSKWDTSGAKCMNSMFFDCSSLTSLDLSGWDTFGVANMNSMFNGCSKLSSVKLGGKFSFKSAASDPEYYAVLPDALDDKAHTGRWVNSSDPDAQGVTAAELRDGYPDATDPSLAPGTYVWEGATMVAVFDGEDGSLTFKREAGVYTDGQVVGTRTYYTGFEDVAYSSGDRPSWLVHASDIEKVDFQTAMAPRSCAYWFAGCAKLAEVQGADKLDASDAASMRCMFSGCSSLAALDASKWETSKVADMGGAFEGCSSLSSLDLSGWDTSGAESMYCMFDGCTGLSSVTLGGKFSFKARSGARYDAVLPDAPSGAGRTGRWVNSSATGAQGVTAAELRDGYPDASDLRFAPGAYAWEAVTDISAAKVTAPDRVYAGKALTPAPTVVLGSKTLKAGADYAVSYKNNVNAGTATVTVTGRGAYAGSASGAFRIAAAGISKAEVKLAKTSYAYDGKAKEPKVKSVKLNGKTLAAGTDYTVSYSNNRKPGQAAATVTGRGNYEGAARAAFSVKLAKAGLSTTADSSGRRVVASWKKVAGAKGYQLQYRRAGGKWRALGVKVTSAAVGGLKAGKLYQFRVRALAGKQKGAWSAASNRYLRPAKGVAAASKKAGAVSVKWRADPRANAGYEVVVRYSRDGGAAVAKTVAAGRTSATVGGLRPGERAWVQVRPLRSSGGAVYKGVLARAKSPVRVAG